MSDRTDQTIIIKKNKKGGGEGHGGSWKVAYADFITSMMAVFLLLWLLNMTSAQKKVALSQYFQNHSIFEKGGGTAVGRYADVAGDGVLDSNSITPAIAQRTFVTSDIAKKIKEQVQSKTKEFNDRVFVFEDSGNLRIELTDTAGSSIFKVGSTELSESGKALIQEIAPVFTSVPNKIIIEGHTDSLGYKSNVFTNWELSTQRASAARIELEKNGVRPQQVEMVAGFADTRPLVREIPGDPKNRRISIVIDSKAKINEPPPLPGHIKPEAPWVTDTVKRNTGS